jgi:HAD superfamily hydrolase (TIGR01509 family)
MKRFRAIILDVDGTLAETEELHRRAFNEAFEHFSVGWHWDVPLYRELLQVTGGKERIRHYAELCKKQGSGRLKLPNDEATLQLHRFKTARFTKLIAEGACSLRPGIGDLIRTSINRGQHLAIATTTSRENVEALCAATMGKEGIKRFDAIVCGDDVARKKPSPDVYLRILDLLERSPGECLAIEDSRNGLIAATGAGIPVVITRSLYFGDEDFRGALVVVDNLGELEDFRLPANSR